ncbi:MXAN_5187 C-terminal domain-containing protein [Sandaracinus amylolyticus]|nr:MXAN_5187 C-terminal domain-containing protein [Sandaracinus amylolyticus]
MRTKIIAGNLAAVLVVGLVSYAMVKASLEAELVGEVDTRIVSDYRLLDRSFRLSARELSELADEQSQQRAMIDIFVSALDEASRRTRAYEAADRVASWLADPSRRGATPDIVVVVDDRGNAVARNADRNRMYGQDLAGALPAVQRALRGDTATGIWQKQDENKVLQVAVAPIRGEDHRVLGALLVGYDVSNGLARAEGELLGRDVAFLLGDRVYSSSLAEGAVSEALGAHLFGPGQAAVQGAMQGNPSAPFTVQLAGDEYVGVVGPVPSGGSQTPLAMVVLANRTAQIGKAGATNVILLLTVIGAIVVLVYGFLIGTSFIRPIEQMEEAILAVINGRTDTRIELESAEYGGLAYRINQLLNVFTGTPEEDEQGRVSSPPGGGGRWQDDSIAQSSIAEPGATPPATAPVAQGAGAGEDEVDPAVAAQLASEPEDAYYARVYREYVAAKQSVGEDVSNIPQDKFVQRLRANEQSLIKKHDCRMVRFQVQTRGTQVNLKPVIIR